MQGPPVLERDSFHYNDVLSMKRSTISFLERSLSKNIIIGILAMLILAMGLSFGTDTGFLNPTADYATTGTQLTLPARAYTSNNQYATGCYYANRGYGTFGFSIPSGSTINGIEVIIEGKSNTAQNCVDFDYGAASVYLSWDNGGTYTVAKTYTAFDTDTDSTVTLGGSTNTWGRTWSASDFADGSFTVKLDIGGGEFQQYIDAIGVKVYYTEAAAAAKDCTLTTAGNPQNLSIPCNCTITRKQATNIDWLSVNETGGTMTIDSSNMTFSHLNITPAQCKIAMNGTFVWAWTPTPKAGA